MNIKFDFTNKETVILLTAIEYFEIFASYEVPVSEDEWDESSFNINNIDTELDDVYSKLEINSTPTLSISDVANLISALSVYHSIVLNNIKTTKKLKLSKSEKEKLLKNIFSLSQLLTASLKELAPNTPFIEYTLTPDTEYI